MLRGRLKRAEFVAAKLDRHIPDPQIPLAHRDPYTLLVAVVLSAQCTDLRVNAVTPTLFALADSPDKMAAADLGAIRDIVRPCGLSERKAFSIKELSRIICEVHGGRVPDDFDALEALPGVGHKTASVVMVQAFGIPAFPVDTHIHRLATRWKLSDGSNVARTERDLKGVFPRENWGRLHLQMILFGRNFCTARGCDGHKCPICSTLNGPLLDHAHGHTHR